MQEYFAGLKSGLDSAYALATEARAKGMDPEDFVEIKPAADVAARVEGIVGPPGIAEVIRKIEAEGKARELVAFEIVKKIVRGELCKGNRDQLIDQAVRTGVGILTEGVLVAPTEGISKIKVMQNPDGSDYLAIYFAGPIRSAGGTVAALSVVLADVARKEFAIGDFRPTDSEIERYVEEMGLYDTRAARLQYKPPEDDMRHVVRNCPVCIDGDPTEEFEVAVHRDLARIPTNRIRGGIALVICEGIAQKASKVLKYAKKIGLDWAWLEAIVKVAKKEGGATQLKPLEGYLDDIVAGRPIFSYPMRPGGFRLRYGRSRASGIMGKSIHPASMAILDSFPAIGTQMKLERPGKGCIISPCDSIDGPVVKLADGSVAQVSSFQQAEDLKAQVAEILFLGDILVSLGDFHKSNHFLVPGGYCYEWWAQEVERAGGKLKPCKQGERGGAGPEISAEEAFRLAKELNVPLHPDYTYFWHDITSEQLSELAHWLKTGTYSADLFKPKKLVLESAPAKRALELVCVPHKVEMGNVIVEGEHACALVRTLGLLGDGNRLSISKFGLIFNPQKDVMETVNELAGVRVKKKAPTYVGSRMGRPEKAKAREMKPAVNVLFPLGMSHKNRSVMSLYKKMKDRDSEGSGITVQVARFQCRECGEISAFTKCACNGKTVPVRSCSKCNRVVKGEKCPYCGMDSTTYDSRNINIVEAFDEAKKRCGNGGMPADIKGVKGLVSSSKIPERLEKGILRARHGISVFRDGTCRFDATDVPLTHFTPAETGVSVEKLRSLGYTKDYVGAELAKQEQVCELKPQDIILSENGVEYFMHIANFVDDELACLYGMKPFYSLKKKEDLVGQLIVGLSPHTSAGVLGRIVGFTKARVGYAHPYFHTAKRRNADGDEDAVMMLMDALLNFSKKFLPQSRGGTMDAPLVLTTILDPKEVDDEVHSMEIVSSYPLELYEAGEKLAMPGEVKVQLVRDVLGTEKQYSGLLFTHDISSINEGPTKTTYVQFKSMQEKVDAQFVLEQKIRAVDAKDVAERVILSHFLPDLYGNLRSFSRQIFRCVDCNVKYRRVPLVGKCPACGGKLLLTINKGGIEKYLQISQVMVERYGLPAYLKQRLQLLESDIASVFEDEKCKQYGLSDFM